MNSANLRFLIVAVLVAIVAVFWVFRSTVGPPTQIQLACVQHGTEANCPVGSSVDLTVNALSDCLGRGAGGTAGLSFVCGQVADCAFACRPWRNVCMHGVRSMTLDRIECEPAEPMARATSESPPPAPPNVQPSQLPAARQPIQSTLAPSPLPVLVDKQSHPTQEGDAGPPAGYRRPEWRLGASDAGIVAGTVGNGVPETLAIDERRWVVCRNNRLIFHADGLLSIRAAPPTFAGTDEVELVHFWEGRRIAKLRANGDAGVILFVLENDFIDVVRNGVGLSIDCDSLPADGGFIQHHGLGALQISRADDRAARPTVFPRGYEYELLVPPPLRVRRTGGPAELDGGMLCLEGRFYFSKQCNSLAGWAVGEERSFIGAQPKGAKDRAAFTLPRAEVDSAPGRGKEMRFRDYPGRRTLVFQVDEM